MKTFKVIFIIISILISFDFLSFPVLSNPISSVISDPILLYSGSSCDLPRLVGDQITGTTLVIFSTCTESGSPSPYVYLSTLTPTINGEITKGAVRKFASGYEALAAYNSTDNNYLLVYSGLVEPDRIQVFDPIRSRKLNYRGNALGGMISYPDKKVNNECPFCIYNPDKNQYMLIWWRGYWVLSEGPAGTNTAMLDNYGELIGNEKNIRPPIIHQGLYWITRPWSGQYNTKSKRYLIMVSERGLLGSVWSGLVYLYSLDDRGNLIGRKRLNSAVLDSNFASLVPSSISEQNDPDNSNHFLAWSETNYLVVQKISKYGQYAAGKKKYLSSSKNCYPSISFSPLLNEYWVSYRDKTGLVVRRLDKYGSTVGSLIRISSNINVYPSSIKWNPYIKKFILVWIEQYSGKPDKVWLTTVSL